ncbi:MAG: DUF4388 domain-containing protein [Pseudomonadota bacterium]
MGGKHGTSDEVTARQERLFAGYHLLNRVSISDHAELYRARQPSLAEGKRFLVKRFRNKDGAFSQALSRRCSKLRSLSHPLIPAVLDHGNAHGYPYMARRYVRGISLNRVVRQLAQRGLALPLEQLMTVVVRVLDAVEVAHVASTADGITTLTHGDLSPSHILLRLDGTPLVIGFESPRGEEPHVPARPQLDISVPSAILYSHLRTTHLVATQEDDTVSERRRRLIDSVQPIVRRGLGLDPKRAFRSPRDLADALRGCLDYSGFTSEPADLVPTLEALVDVTQSGDTSGLRPLPLQQRRTNSAPLSPAIDVGLSEDAPLTRSPLDEVSVPRRPAAPAPVDFGEPVPQPPRAHPLPAFEWMDGDEALAEETARAISESFSDILDPFDDVSAEFEFTDISNPFGFEASTDQAALAAARSQSTQRIGNVLAELGFVSYRDVRQALDRQGRGVRLGEALVRQGSITELQLVQALGVLHDLPVLSDAQVSELVPDAVAVAALPATFVAAHRIVPLAVDAASSVAQVLMVDPTDREAMVEARVLLEVQCLQSKLATRDATDALIARLYPSGLRSEISVVKATVLLVDPDEGRRRGCANHLRGERFVVDDVATTARARRVLDAAVPAAVIVCVPDSDDGLALLRDFRARASAAGAYAALAGNLEHISYDQAEAIGADLVPLPLRVEYVSAKIRRTLASREEESRPRPPEEGIRGHLADMNLLELVQTLRLGRRSATITIDTLLGQGVVVMRDGNIVDAHYAGLTGDKAFVSQAMVSEGFFVVIYRIAEDIHRTVFASTESLLIEAARQTWFRDDEPAS